MQLTQHRSRRWITKSCFMLVNIIILSALPFAAYAEHMLALRLAPTPFSPSMCKISKGDASIRILAAKHHNLFSKKFPANTSPRTPHNPGKKTMCILSR